MTAENDSVRAEFEQTMAPIFEKEFGMNPDADTWHKHSDGKYLALVIEQHFATWQASRERYVPSGAVEFARHMLTEVWPEGGIDGGELQDLGERFGLLKPVEVAEPCGEGCNCEGYGDFPMTCYKLNLSATHSVGNES